MSEVQRTEKRVIQTGPWDECFSSRGGLVVPSTVLLSGAPGAGKSTMVLQIAVALLAHYEKVIYCSIEEPYEDVTERADRLGVSKVLQSRIEFDRPEELDELTYDAAPIIFDSISAWAPNYAEQEELLMYLYRYSDVQKVPVFAIQHVSKEDPFAGPMALQHCVTTTCTLYQRSPDEADPVRVMTTLKNRQGPAPFKLTLCMTEHGLISDTHPDKFDGD